MLIIHLPKAQSRRHRQLRVSHRWAHKAPRDHSKLREALKALAQSQRHA